MLKHLSQVKMIFFFCCKMSQPASKHCTADIRYQYAFINKNYLNFLSTFLCLNKVIRRILDKIYFNILRLTLLLVLERKPFQKAHYVIRFFHHSEN